MTKKKTSKCLCIIRKMMLVGVLVSIANKFSQCEKEKALCLKRRKEQNRELKTGRKFFTDEDRDLW